MGTKNIQLMKGYLIVIVKVREKTIIILIGGKKGTIKIRKVQTIEKPD